MRSLWSCLPFYDDIRMVLDLRDVGTLGFKMKESEVHSAEHKTLGGKLLN